MESTRNKNNKKSVKSWIGLIALGLAVVLIFSFVFTSSSSASGGSSAKYYPIPDSAADGFSGKMLSNYDNIKLNFGEGYVRFDFEDVSLSDFDYIVLDVVDSVPMPNDSYTNVLAPVFSTESIDLSNSFCLDMTSFVYKSYPYFNGEYSQYSECNHTYSYVLDLTEYSDGKMTVNFYLDGEYSSTKTVEELEEGVTLNYLNFKYEGMDGNVDGNVFGGIYLYGFEDECTIGDYIADTTLKLTDCKDSMLYAA